LNPEQIKKLSRDQLLLYHEYVKEVKRRQRDRREAYKPNRGQLPVHQSQAKIRAVFSGNGAGKTALGANEAVWAATGFNPLTNSFTKVPARVIVVLDDPDKVRDLWIPEIEKWHNIDLWEKRKNGKPYLNELVAPNGSSIKFMFHLQEELKFESIEADLCCFDEPPPRHVWIGLLRGGRKAGRQARYLFIGTPLSGSWLSKDIYEPWAKGEREDIDCFKFGTEVNEANLSEDYIESFSRNLTEKERRIRLHGDFFDLDGLALSHLFNQRSHVIYGALETPLAVVAIDPHPNKAHVAILMGTDDQGYLYAIDEIASKSVPRVFANELKAFYQSYNLFDIVCDSYGNTPMTGGEGHKTFIEVLREEGIRVRPTSYEDKKDDSWIMRIQDALTIPHLPDNFGNKIPKLRIHERCKGLISDIETVSWVKMRHEDAYKPKLDISQKDYLACLKYALATNLAPGRKKAKIFTRVNKPSSYGIQKKKGYDYWRKKFLKPRSGIMTKKSKPKDTGDW